MIVLNKNRNFYDRFLTKYAIVKGLMKIAVLINTDKSNNKRMCNEISKEMRMIKVGLTVFSNI